MFAWAQFPPPILFYFVFGFFFFICFSPDCLLCGFYFACLSRLLVRMSALRAIVDAGRAAAIAAAAAAATAKPEIGTGKARAKTSGSSDVSLESTDVRETAQILF